MVNYIQKVTASDVSPFADGNRVMSVGTGTDTNFSTGNIANGGGTVQHGFITLAAFPNNDNWEEGNTTVEIEVDTGDGNIDLNCRMVRIDAAGNIEESGAFAGNQAMDVSRTYSCASPATWGASGDALVCSDRLAVELLFTNNAAHGNHAVVVGLGTAANEVITVILEDSAGCVAVAALPFPAIVNSSAMMAFSTLLFYGQMLLSKVGVMAKPCPCRKKKIILKVIK